MLRCFSPLPELAIAATGVSDRHFGLPPREEGRGAISSSVRDVAHLNMAICLVGHVGGRIYFFLSSFLSLADGINWMKHGLFASGALWPSSGNLFLILLWYFGVLPSLTLINSNPAPFFFQAPVLLASLHPLPTQYLVIFDVRINAYMKSQERAKKER